MKGKGLDASDRAILAWHLRRQDLPMDATLSELTPEVVLGDPAAATRIAAHVPDMAERLVREASFMMRHRDRFQPGPTYVPPVAEAPAPARVPEAAFASRGDLDLRLDIPRLSRLGAPGGMSADEAISILRSVRGTAAEIRAVEWTLSARRHGVLPEPVRIECAYLLVARGERARALAVLEDVGELEPPGKLSRAAAQVDVSAEVSERDAAAAARAAERALADDVDAPGVRERFERWRAIARSARLTPEVFRSLGGLSKREQARVVARALEDAGEAAMAAEVYALAGDHDDKQRLGVSPERAGGAAPALAELHALDRSGRRLAALGEARARLADHPDVEVAAFARGVVARLVRGPVVDLAIDGARRRYALGAEITIGRSGATIAVASPAASRKHLRLYRRGGEPFVEDLRSHNGTFLAGARCEVPLAVGAGLRLTLGDEAPCWIRPAGEAVAEGAILVDVAGESIVVPLGAARFGVLEIALLGDGDDRVVVLRAGGAPPPRWLGDTAIAGDVELCVGDVIRAEGAGPQRLEVLRG